MTGVLQSFYFTSMKNSFINLSVLITLSCLISCTDPVSKLKVRSAANEPTIQEGSTIVLSKSKMPKRFDFICFNNEVEGMGGFEAVFRLCGMEGDTVEIKNGDLYVNGQMEDDQFNLMQLFAVPSAELNRIANKVTIDEAVPNEKGDSVRLFLSTAFVRQQQLKCTRIVLPKKKKDDDIARIFHQSWNPDQFGPVTVPRGHYFVLGDNRRHAADSRYIGFISKNQVVGTVILN
jgi:signal peptidase I